MQNRQFIFAPKIQYKLAAERSEAASSGLQFPQWCAGEDSNLHVLADTSTSSWPGYRYCTRALLCFISISKNFLNFKYFLSKRGKLSE